MNDYFLNQTTATDETFWSLINKNDSLNSIHIPRIQRDYAQGREDETTSQIRERLISDIFNSLENQQVLDLNFIYGNIEIDNESGTIINRRFIPIDGQQRLTTLFLVYWYFAMYSNKLHDDAALHIRDALSQFSYDTRDVTKTFCEHLVKDVFIDLKSIKGESDSLKNAIKDYYWFFNDYENDPSISNMLVVLEEIHKWASIYSDEVLESFFDRLISEDCPLRFSFLNIDDVGLTDTIYIKMNARGKPLTPFENFKAQLSDFLNDDPSFSKEFLAHVNGEWSQFFWTPEYRKDTPQGKETVFDSHIMKFIRFFIFCEFMGSVKDESLVIGQKSIRDSIKVLRDESDYVFSSRLFKDGFATAEHILSKDNVITTNTFRKLFILLNVLAKRKRENGSISFIDSSEYGKKYLDEEKSFIKLIGSSDEKALNNTEEIVLFAEYAFITKYAKTDYSFDKEKELNRFIRVVYNLSKATLVLQDDSYLRMIRSICALVNSDSAIHINEHMAKQLRNNYRQSIFFSFYESQVVEESIKATLIEQSSDWKDIISAAENSFLDNQLSMPLIFSGIWDKYCDQITAYEFAHPERDSLEDVVIKDVCFHSPENLSFILYMNKINALFDCDGLKKEFETDSIFRRALFCFGDNDSYLLPTGKAVQSFLDNTERDYGLKRLFRDDNRKKQQFFKELLDLIDLDNDIVSQLESIIEAKRSSLPKWKKYFVEMPEILNSMHKNPEGRDPEGSFVFESTLRFVYHQGEDQVLLLTKTQTNSINRELFSYVMYLKARKNGLNVHYHADSTVSAEKYLYYINRQDKEIRVVYKREQENSSYCFYVIENEYVTTYGEMDNILDYISKNIKK